MSIQTLCAKPVAVSKLPTQYKGLKDAFSNVGLTHAEGVKDIGRIASFIELANRECVIVSDADKPALEKQKLHKAEKRHGEWLTYDELLASSVTTEEDFIEPTTFMPILKKIRARKTELPELKVESLQVEANRLHVIQTWLEKAFSKDEVKPILNEIKEELFNNLKTSQIESRYYEFLEKLASELVTNKNVAP